MKNFILIIVLLVFFKGFTQKNDVLEFKYTASTRGVLNKIIIKKDSTSIKTIDQSQTIKTDPKNWNTLLLLVKTIDLEKLEKLESPSDKRFSDTALSANLYITTTIKEYKSSNFDHGNAPDEIKSIVNELIILLE